MAAQAASQVWLDMGVQDLGSWVRFQNGVTYFEGVNVKSWAECKCHLRYSCILSHDTSRMQEYHKCNFLFPLFLS